MIPTSFARLLKSIPIVLLAVTWSLPATAFEWGGAKKLLASDGAANDFFGSVALSGDVALVGAAGETSNPGSAYVFRFNGSQWVEEQKLLASDGAGDDEFGWSVALSGDVALVGAPQDDDRGLDSGSAYVFRFDGTQWVEEQKLVATRGLVTGNQFGESVALSGDVALVGAWRDSNRTGAAYAYRFDGVQWVEEQKLLASDGVAFDEFGFSVALSGDVALVGAGRHDVGGFGSINGSAYVFRFDGVQWVEEQKLFQSDGGLFDRFGFSVALLGDVALVGANEVDDIGGGLNFGSAYVFRFDGTQWVEEQKLLTSDGAAGDQFGTSVALSGDVTLIGAERDDSSRGSAYVFRFDGVQWVEEQKLLASDGAQRDFFGNSVALSGDRALVGAFGDDDSGDFSGSAYVFERSRCLIDLLAGYGGGMFEIGFRIHTREPTEWNVWMFLLNFDLAFELWSIPLPVIDPPVDVPLVFPFPQVGPVLVLTWMETATPELCAFDLDIVDTGTP